MIRSVTRNLFRFSAAILLFALGVCAAEVGLRGWRLYSGLNHSPHGISARDFIVPSASSWIDVRPLGEANLVDESGQTLVVSTNSLGLRGDLPTIPKPRGGYRILCLGGETVFGSRCAENETIPARLEAYLDRYSGRDVEVINGGCPGAGPLVNLLRYRTRLATLQPDLVVLCLSPEDLGHEDVVRGALRLDAAKMPASASHPGTTKRGCEVVDGLCHEFTVIDQVLRWAGDQAGLDGEPSSAFAPAEPVRPLDFAPIVPLQKLIASNFATLSVSLAPSPWSMRPMGTPASSTAAGFNDSARQFLKDVQLSDQVLLQDSVAEFRSLPDWKSYFSETTHGLTPAGRDLYARQLAAFLIERVADLRSSPARQSPPQAVPSSENRRATPGVPEPESASDRPAPIPFAPEGRAMPREGTSTLLR